MVTANWWTASIPGIIILGALGSVLGTILIWVLVKITKSVFPKSQQWLSKIIQMAMVRFFTKPYIAQAKLIITEDQNYSRAFYAFTLAELILILFGLSWLIALSCVTFYFQHYLVCGIAVGGVVLNVFSLLRVMVTLMLPQSEKIYPMIQKKTYDIAVKFESFHED